MNRKRRWYEGDAWSRILDATFLDHKTGCWIWCGAKVYNRRGRPYGVIKIDGEMQLVHRVVREIIDGSPMPRRRVGAHKCDNTLCCNPDHIRKTTQKSNIREASTKQRLYRQLSWLGNNG